MTTAEIAARIRQITPPAPREPCFVCRRYKLITHQHHLLPVSDLARVVQRRDLLSAPLYLPTVWLCPNHHAIAHILYRKPIMHSIYECLTQDELAAFDRMAALVDRDRVVEMLGQAGGAA